MVDVAGIEEILHAVLERGYETTSARLGRR